MGSSTGSRLQQSPIAQTAQDARLRISKSTGEAQVSSGGCVPTGLARPKPLNRSASQVFDSDYESGSTSEYPE